MASENLDLVRSIDPPCERGMTAWADPQIEFVIVDGPEHEQRNRTPPCCQCVGRIHECLGAVSAQGKAFRELDDERVLADRTR